MSKGLRVFGGWVLLMLGNIWLHQLQKPADAMVMFFAAFYMFISAMMIKDKEK